MISHGAMTDEIRDRAASFVMGGMPDEEKAPYEAHLRGCALCRAEVDAVHSIADDLALAVPEVAPPPGLRASVLAAVKSRPAALIRDAPSDWERTEIRGVSFRPLLRDVENDRQTILVRLQPGAVYPVHTHAGTEECFVVSGDLLDGSLRMARGDYSRYERGTRHGPLSTDQGCVLLVTSSLHDAIDA